MTQVQTVVAVVNGYEGGAYALSHAQLVAEIGKLVKKDSEIKKLANPVLRAIAVDCHAGCKTKKEVEKKAMDWVGIIANALGTRYAKAFGSTMKSILDTGLPVQKELDRLDFFAFEAPKDKTETEKAPAPAPEHGVATVIAMLESLTAKKSASKNVKIRKEGACYAFLLDIMKENAKKFA